MMQERKKGKIEGEKKNKGKTESRNTVKRKLTDNNVTSATSST